MSGRSREHRRDRHSTGPPLPSWQRPVAERFRLAHAEGWYALLHALAPDTPPHRPDAVLVGPRGVLVVLLRAEPPAAEHARGAFRWTAELLANARTATGPVADTALRTTAVHPGDHPVPAPADFQLLDARAAGDLLHRGDVVLTPDDARALAHHLAGHTLDLEPHGWTARTLPQQRNRTDPAGTAAPAEHPGDDAGRDWRLFPDEEQAGIVRRRYAGPARLAGPPGTGKTVLALHRLAHYARRVDGALLFTAHTSTASRAARDRFRRLAPQVEHRVEFAHLHGWAKHLLHARGEPAEVDEDAVRRALQAAWRDPRTEPLRRFRPRQAYWRDEIDRVIKGRGIADATAYRHVPRTGPGRLPARLHDAVWHFYQAYERELAARGALDHNDVLARALAQLQRHPLSRPYAMAVVDDVQDLTPLGLRLVHAISGDGPNQLLLVGDGQQQIHSGGWCLADAGVPLRGRHEVLRWNYRNREALAADARRIDAGNRFDDVHTASAAPAVPLSGGGQVVEWSGGAEHQQQALLDGLAELTARAHSGARPAWANAAVLTRTNATARRWKDALRAAGYPVAWVDEWRGDRAAQVFVGTVHRAAHAEFRAVFLPDDPEVPPPEHPEEHDQERRLRLVARSRAADFLWAGTITDAASG
ncbi:UvrD-helicase domain-containing protein [Salinifilum ghardaiensis]